MTGTGPRIGVAISGGGFRATAFGLGCLRALHDTGLLAHVNVISGISGGSILSAMYAYGPADFDDFDEQAVQLLRGGLQRALIRRAFTPAAIGRNLSAAGRAAAFRLGAPKPGLRTANRTDALRDELVDRVFGDRAVDQPTHPRTASVVTATDLGTSNAVRFGSTGSSCSRYGVITDPVPVADAVAASAAFPLLLPAIERTYTFAPAAGSATTTRQVLHLTDGGVYDNLGLSVLELGRSAAHTAHVYDLDYVIACDAGTGRLPLSAGHFAPARLRRSFETVHRRAQDAARSKLHEAAATGKIAGFVHAYLGMRDNRLPIPISDLIPDTAVSAYPTDLRAIALDDLTALTLRAEQLTRALMAHYCPELV